MVKAFKLICIIAFLVANLSGCGDRCIRQEMEIDLSTLTNFDNTNAATVQVVNVTKRDTITLYPYFYHGRYMHARNGDVMHLQFLPDDSTQQYTVEYEMFGELQNCSTKPYVAEFEVSGVSAGDIL